VRVHRSHIVNGGHVAALIRDGGGLLVELASGDSVPVGRRRQREVERWFVGLGR
jgi:DNA-binding LytR/AlgR family response regulator